MPSIFTWTWPRWLPQGGSLPDAAWRTRHRAVVAILWAHVVAIPVYAVWRDNSLGHAWVEAAPVLMAATVVSSLRLSRVVAATVAAGGLMASSGVIVHLSDGIIESHFHFFVMIPVIALYEAWPPFTVGVLYVLVHHGLMGMADPRAVYNHPAAWERPWLFAVVHAGFFACAAVACIVNWRLHERARNAVHAQSRLLATIVDSLQEGLIVLDQDERVRLRNPAGKELLDGLEDAYDGRRLSYVDGTPVLHPELPHVRALAGESVEEVDLVVRTADVPDGRVLNFSTIPLLSAPGDRTDDVVVIVFRDVTKRYRVEQALTAALRTEQEVVERLREVERAKTDFVSTVSHELRTPLTSIMGYLEILIDGAAGDLQERQLTLLERIERNSARLLTLVEDLLTLSQIESARLTITAVPTDLRDTVTGAMDAVAWMLDARELELSVDVPEVRVGCEVDPAQIERLLVNLLTNAVKFTPDGGRVGVRLGLHDDVATLVVTDTGIGIPEGEQDRLFTRFFRSSTATARAIQGTGLGLTIVQAIVALHGGTVHLESSTGRGTAATVRLPRRHGAPVELDGELSLDTPSGAVRR